MSNRDQDQQRHMNPQSQREGSGGQRQQSQNPGHDRGGPSRQQGDAGLGKDPQRQDSRKRS